uniref:NADH-ubiquinone oxidoreductase chain 4L n=1 Tax=Scotomedes sp. TaxID=2931908 RepID=A0A8T9W451_9HEMI|nr:NADH dehydrogenase subunit 4L [Scotomedes sp.]
MNLFDMMCMVMYTVGVMVFCSVRSHLLLSLLSLEYLVLVLFMILFYYMMKCGCGSYFILLYLTYTVCEGVMGLSILVALIRCHGNDNLSSMMMLW